MKAFEQRGTAILRRLSGVPRPWVAEIGVLTGMLSEYLLSHSPTLELVMVDNWATADAQPEAYKATGDEHAHHADPARVSSHRRQAEKRARRFTGRARIVAERSVDAARRVADCSLDLVFLDADHSYEGVTADLAAWAPKVRPGGWIGGHDYRNPDPRFRFGVERAVDEWIAGRGLELELDLNLTWFARL